jgi:hypothetical protein
MSFNSFQREKYAMTQSTNVVANPLHELETLFGMLKYNFFLHNKAKTDSSPIEQFISKGNRPTEFDASKHFEDLLQLDLDLDKV